MTRWEGAVKRVNRSCHPFTEALGKLGRWQCLRNECAIEQDCLEDQTHRYLVVRSMDDVDLAPGLKMVFLDDP